jgi:hypothetical protein
MSAAASASADQADDHVVRARALMLELRAESRRDARRIEDAYGRLGGALRDRDALRNAIGSGIIAQMPLETTPFNLRLRMDGRHPIGEFDRPNQHLYAAAHPAALGALILIASRVETAPLEVTSLVRHADYQRRLGASNPNARTSLAMHTYGLAFDISILNVPLETAREIRDVLRRMRDDGEIFFVAEVNQLVFHVVVAPTRAGYHGELFAAVAAVPPPPWRDRPLPQTVDVDGELASVASLQLAAAQRTLGGGFFLPPALAAAGALAALWRRRKRIQGR